MNYRSVIAYGLATVVDDLEESAVLTALVDAVVPDRSTGTGDPTSVSSPPPLSFGCR